MQQHLFLVELLFFGIAYSEDQECLELHASEKEYNTFTSHEGFDGVSVPYPRQYTPCWVIKGPDGKMIRASAELFNLEPDDNCDQGDYVTAYCGDSAKGDKIGRFCSRYPMTILYSSGNSISFYFHTDETENTHAGFKISYSAIGSDYFTPSCQQDRNASNIVLIILGEVLLVMAVAVTLVVAATIGQCIYVRLIKARRRPANCGKQTDSASLGSGISAFTDDAVVQTIVEDTTSPLMTSQASDQSNDAFNCLKSNQCSAACIPGARSERNFAASNDMNLHNGDIRAKNDQITSVLTSM